MHLNEFKLQMEALGRLVISPAKATERITTRSVLAERYNPLPFVLRNAYLELYQMLCHGQVMSETFGWDTVLRREIGDQLSSRRVISALTQIGSSYQRCMHMTDGNSPLHAYVAIQGVWFVVRGPPSS